MPDFDAIARGLAYEDRVAKLLGGRTTPGSGNTYHTKGDVLGVFCVSAKAEATKSWNRIREQMKEAVDMALGTGRIPALATLDPDGEELLIIRLADASRFLEHGGTIEIERSRADEKRALADVPFMLRGE